MKYDVVIVGARCAGSTLALPLARAGKKVLLVDAAEPGSDQPLSQHYVHGFGMSLLDDLGLGDRVRAVAPPIAAVVMGVDESRACVTLTGSERPCCVRRTELDSILLEGAREAGAEVRMRTRLVELLREDDRVVGVVVEHAGQREEIRADLVVGADGQHSTVAARVSAEEYKVAEGERAIIFGYVERPEWFAADPYFRGGFNLLHVGDTMFTVSPVNTDQLLMSIWVPRAQVPEWTGDKRAHLAERYRRIPHLARLADCEPVGKVVAYLKPRYFFRQAVGPGWALVGDAGLFLDPTMGLGISDALRDSAALARAILEGTPVSLEHYWRERDAISLELFAWCQDTGHATYNNALNRAVVAEVATNTDYQRRFQEVLMRTRSPYALVPMSGALAIVGRELLHGRFSVLGEFFAVGKRSGEVAKELAEWKSRVPTKAAAHSAPT